MGRKPVLELTGAIYSEEESGEERITFHFPFAMFGLPDFSKRESPSFERPYTVAYLVSNCVRRREDLFRMILERTSHQVTHSLGRCSNNLRGIEKMNREVGKHVRSYSNSTHNPFIFKHYKFALVMENSIGEGYVTEKIVNAILGGAVPIYWGGGKYTNQVFNPKAMIRVEDFKSLDECASRVVELSKNRKEYEKIASAFPFVGNEIPDIFKKQHSELIREVASLMRKRVRI